MRFSDRIGITQANNVLQTQGMSDELRSSLWNILTLCIWKKRNFLLSTYESRGDNIKTFSNGLWFYYFKKPLDSRPGHGDDILQFIRSYFFESEWYDVYNFLEYVLSSRKDDNLIKGINKILEIELSGYRFIDSHFVPITDEIEIKAIQNAIAEGPFSGVHEHLKTSLEHLSRRENPDYRNSIKESISAVESMVREITQNPKATLGDALSTLEKKGQLHSALKKAFSAFYGYTSNEGGIRHAMLEKPDITISDAKFFLVTCSSFINYLKSKYLEKSAINLSAPV